MAVLDRETVLDLAVNIVPLALILLFAALTVLVAPLGRTVLFTHLVELGLLAVPFAVLALVTYLAGRAIMLDEERVEAEADQKPPGTVAPPADEVDRSEAEAEEPGPDAESDREESGAETEPDTEPTASDTERRSRT